MPILRRRIDIDAPCVEAGFRAGGRCGCVAGWRFEVVDDRFDVWPWAVIEWVADGAAASIAQCWGNEPWGWRWCVPFIFWWPARGHPLPLEFVRLFPGGSDRTEATPSWQGDVIASGP